MGMLLKRLARAGQLVGMDADTIEKVIKADEISRKRAAKDDEDSGWRTLEGGTKVHFSEGGGGGTGGKIDKGPSNMKGKTMGQVKAEGKAQTAARRAAKAATKPAAVKPAKTPSKPGGAAKPAGAAPASGAAKSGGAESNEAGRRSSKKQEAMRNKLHNIAWQYMAYGPDYPGERKELLKKWNDNVSKAKAAGISNEEMNEIFHNPNVNIARRLFEPSGVAYDPQKGGSAVKSSGLSQVYEKKSVSKRDTALQSKLSASAGDKESMKKVLDEMKPGTVLRYNERGYSLYTKQADGSWTYQNAFSSSAQPTTTDKMFEDAQAWKDPKTGVKDPSKAFQGVAVPKKGEAGRSAEWDARRALANLEHNPGDDYTGKRVTLAEAIANAKVRMGKEGKLGEGSSFPKEKGDKSAEYTKTSYGDSGEILSAGKPVGKLEKGSGVTMINRGDIFAPNPGDGVYNTLQEHCVEDKNGNLVLTPEREKLHEDIMEETFANANPVKPGEKKVFTMLGGGSAAGKGTIQKMMPELFNKDSPVIDADEMKKRIPEYVDTAFSPGHRRAASLAHEESSALAKRAMQTAFANGYNCTLDGTGDGNPKSMIKKIKDAQANGYNVEGVYVTCPTELAVERNAARSRTDEYNRLVGEKAVRNIHAAVSRIFPEVAPMMDHVVLYDTNQPNGAKPKKIAECWKGQKIKVYDDKLYKDFLDKGNEKAD